MCLPLVLIDRVPGKLKILYVPRYLGGFIYHVWFRLSMSSALIFGPARVLELQALVKKRKSAKETHVHFAADPLWLGRTRFPAAVSVLRAYA